MRKSIFLFIFLLSSALWAQTLQPWGKKVHNQDQPVGKEQILSKQMGAQVLDYGTPPFNNPNYSYASVKTAPTNVWYRQAGLSPNGQKIVAGKQYTDGSFTRREVVLMNADGTGEVIISAGNSGEGDIVQYGNPFWSDDGLVIGYVEAHVANPNKVVKYVVSSSVSTYIYEPVASLDVNNADFLGNSTTSIVFWDLVAGEADLFTWDGVTRTNITNSGGYKEYEPVSNGDGTVILYWSGETVTEPVNTTHTLTYSGVWTKDVGFTPITDSYWSYWSARADNYIGVTVMSSKDVHIYNSAGTFVFDLTGPEYSGGAGQWNFLGSGFEGPTGEILMTSNAGRTTNGRDIVFAIPIMPVPANYAVGVSVNPIFSFRNYSAGATSYTFELYLQSTSTPIVYSATITPSQASSGFTIPITLNNNTQYVWFVKANNEANYHPTNSHPNGYLFTTVLSTPVLATPTNGSVGVSIVPTLTWTMAGNYSNVDFYVDYRTTGSVPWIPAPFIHGLLTTTLPSLVNSVSYDWRVRAYVNAAPPPPNDGETKTSASIWQFTTVTAAMPYLVLPANASTVSGTTINFSWYCTVYGVLFDLQYDDDPTFGSPTTIASDLSTTYYSFDASSLTPGSTYKWRVISKTPAGVIASYSAKWSFTMAGLPVPVPSYPTGGVTVYTDAPTIYWYLGTYISGIDFEIQWGTSPSSYTHSITSTSGNYFYTLTGVSAGQTIYYQVQSKLGSYTSDWSAEKSFVVYYTSSSLTVYPSYPIGGATVYVNPPTLYWYTSTYAPGITFDVEYYNSSWHSLGTTPDYYYTFGSSLPSGTYKWRVKVTSSSSWSTEPTFIIPSSSTSSSAPVPTPSYPIGGVTIYTLTPTLYWYAYSASTLEYQVKWSSNSSQTGGVLTTATHTTSFSTPSSYDITSGLVAGAAYYWQVRAKVSGVSDSTQWSAWSSIKSFATAAGASSVVPVIGGPSNGVPVTQNSAVLSWILPTQSSSKLTYELEYANNPELKGSTVVSGIDKPNYQLNELQQGKTYYWRVLSKTDKGEKSSYSSIGNFNSGSVTSVEEKQTLPTAFELSQNYPNPFNPTTKISYSLPQNSYVSIKVYDMLGREVRSLVNNEMLAGNHSIEWSGMDNAGSKVASGTYIYRITAGSFVAVKKMILIK